MFRNRMASAEKERDRVEEKLAEVLPEMDKLQAGGQATHVTLVFIEKGLNFAQICTFTDNLVWQLKEARV
jgi:hypothetical protein